MHTNNIVIRHNISPPSEARHRVIFLFILFYFILFLHPKIPLPILPYIEPHIEKKMAVVYSEKRRERRVAGGIGEPGNSPLFTVLYILFYFINYNYYFILN